MNRVCAVAILAFAMPALAASPAEGAFRALDRDGDGYLSPREAAGSLPDVRSFQNADADGDGRLSPQEFRDSALDRPAVAAAASARDREITARVRDLLAREPGLQSVEPATEHGQVVLSGEVETPAQRDRAAHLAMSVDGVRDVVPSLAVRQRHN